MACPTSVPGPEETGLSGGPAGDDGSRWSTARRVAAIVEPAIRPSSPNISNVTFFNIKCKSTRTLLLVTFRLPCSEPSLTRRSIQAALTSNPAVMGRRGRGGLFMDGN
jgi:hypothetical protein